MVKTKEFAEEIEAHFLEEFGGFSIRSYRNPLFKGFEVRKRIGAETLSRILTFDEIDATVLSGTNLARLTIDIMNEEWDTYVTSEEHPLEVGY